MISIDYRSDKPLHEQIQNGIKTLIISGSFPADEKLPSVRELSVSLTVNPNTVQRAYKDLEAEGFIYSVQGKGNFVSPYAESGSRHEKELFDDLEKCVKELAWLGANKAEILNLVNNIFDERVNNE